MRRMRKLHGNLILYYVGKYVCLSVCDEFNLKKKKKQIIKEI